MDEELTDRRKDQDDHNEASGSPELLPARQPASLGRRAIDRRHRLEIGAVQTATVAGVLGALALAVLGGHPGHLPGVALGSEPLYLLERSAAMFVGWSAAIALVVRGLRGEVASGVGRDGLTFSEDVQKATQDLTTAVARLETENKTVNDRLAAGDAEFVKLSGLLTKVVERARPVDQRASASAELGRRE